ncbi:conserved unknown protein [Ectocarpus siliculosus]|uniref:PARP catalytic domain-containing protein n=1 Tax=Ectocarpus siliculosus TaxID=2880 RepID=D8LS85_ECTSI|nr:conserved unknown protein [Ectocarpus siliculosus]|eukprot:CBN75142.1 conserved unknown protein [Ectocarpus siliculosus]
MCQLPGCKEPAHFNPNTGKASEYCSMKHVHEAKSRECARSECSRTAFLANTAGLQFCSRACVNEALGETTSTVLNQTLDDETNCGLPGCQQKALPGGTWRSLRFCSEAHRILFVQRTPVPFGQPSAEPYTTQVVVARDNTSALELRFLDEGHPEHKSLADQFTSKWLHSKPKLGVEVLNVVKIEVPREVRERHEDYKTMVPNVRRRFHGTFSSRICRFYVGGSMCLRPDCGLCNICMRGFKIEDNVGHSPARGKRRQWLMYGKGLYFSSVSGKANDFSAETEKLATDGTTVRCMLVADVAAGKAFVTTEKYFPQMERPPLGYNSVVGEVGPHLNYDELVVYDPAAALPTHFVVYRNKSPPPASPTLKIENRETSRKRRGGHVSSSSEGKVRRLTPSRSRPRP